MKKENGVICPPCGERACPRRFLSGVALATKRGANKVSPILPLLPRLSAVLPPQGREITTRGFTLIELLVVVLIIGILAAVAVPQYQKAVWKSKNALLKHYTSTLAKAEELYLLTNGKTATNFSELDISLPLTPVTTSPNTKFLPCQFVVGGTNSVLRGDGFEVMINATSSSANQGKYSIKAYWTQGPYKCAGFNQDNYRFNKKLVCIEGFQGSFCQKIEQGHPITGNQGFYTLP